MKWNDGKERTKFINRQKKLYNDYILAGMTDEQIKKIYEYDLSVYRKERREAVHTQKLDFDSDEFDDKETDNPLLEKFIKAISVTPEITDLSNYGWIEEIEDENLAKAIKSLTKADLKILTLLFCDGYSQRELAQMKNIKEAAISRKIGRLKKILKKFLI